MNVFKHLREKMQWSKYQAAKELHLMQNEYERLENGTQGERYIKLLLKMSKLTKTNWAEIKKLLKD